MNSWQDLAGGPWPAYAGPQPAPGRLAAGAYRRVGAPPVAVRPVLLRTIRELSFDLRTEQLSVLEATRGSRLGAVTMLAGKLPIELRVLLEPDGPGTAVAIVLMDQWPARVGRTWGATAGYIEAFEAVLSTDGRRARPAQPDHALRPVVAGHRAGRPRRDAQRRRPHRARQRGADPADLPRPGPDRAAHRRGQQRRRADVHLRRTRRRSPTSPPTWPTRC